MADSLMKLNYGDGSYYEITQPLFGYKSTLNMPLSIVKKGNGLYGIYDAGATYDIRQCECTFELSTTEYGYLLDIINNQNRGADVTIELVSGSGFHPFMPDKGDSGEFTVALELLSTTGVGSAPYLYWHATVRMTNTGSYPSYALPSETAEGSWTFGTVTNVRFPEDWFKPVVNYAITPNLSRGSTMYYADRGAYADSYETSFLLECNESKTAKILEYISGTARGGSFTIATGSNYYAFEYDKGSSATYNVRLMQNVITTEHVDYNLFHTNMSLSYESTA